ncbi:hypothetical protein [Nocardia australiensis]|uniref:hypothetical protein n=1 Tax=Nocardia australiensis TaxID=2887191 RepID=UPI001D14A6ED|nr:hypothetical protein [Nocardia australiensis]
MTIQDSSSTTVRVAVASGPTSPGSTADWELFFARRALAKLKSRLGRQNIIDLLKPDVEAATEQLEEWARLSKGQWQPAITELEISGLSASEFLAYFNSIKNDEPKLWAAEPEHFVVDHIEGGDGVIENLGPHIAHIFIHFTDESSAVVAPLPEYPIRMVAYADTASGTVVARVLHQFRDTGDGFRAKLCIFFPTAAPEEFVEAHRQHLAVEFTNWILLAGESLGRPLASPAPVVAGSNSAE